MILSVYPDIDGFSLWQNQKTLYPQIPIYSPENTFYYLQNTVPSIWLTKRDVSQTKQGEKCFFFYPECLQKLPKVADGKMTEAQTAALSLQ